MDISQCTHVFKDNSFPFDTTVCNPFLVYLNFLLLKKKSPKPTKPLCGKELTALA